MKKMCYMIVIMIVLSTMITALNTVMAETGVISDPEDDVLAIFYDETGEIEQFVTDEVPSADFVEVSYKREPGGTEITVGFKVNERGTVETMDLDDFIIGSILPIAYNIIIITNQSKYEIIFQNNETTLNNDEDLDYTVLDNEFSATFHLNSADETILEFGAQSFFMKFSLTSTTIYVDAAPDSFMFMAEINAPSIAYVKESIRLTCHAYNLADIFGISIVDYTYSWEFGDGSTGDGKIVSHSYQYPGTYTIIVTVSDPGGLETIATASITILDDDIAPTLIIDKPTSAFYINNRKLIDLPYFKPVILGPIEIEVTAFDYQSGVDRVEFYINNELQSVATSEPYSYNWLLDSRSLFNHNYAIKVICYDVSGNFAEKEIMARRYFGISRLEPWDIIVPDDYPTIQAAVDNVGLEKGYRIFVRSGIYYENVLISTDDVTLHGENKDNTIIDGNGEGNVLFLDSGYNTISGFTIRNSGLTDAGIDVKTSNNDINNNIIKNTYIGVNSAGADYNSINNNIFIFNKMCGIYISARSDYNNIKYNLFEDNLYAIRIKGARFNQVVGNDFFNNRRGIYVCCGATSNKVYYNNFMKNIIWFINETVWSAQDDVSGNVWYNEETNQGNYWGDYMENYPNATQTNGIWNTPYHINGLGQSQDLYPLVEPYDNSLSNTNKFVCKCIIEEATNTYNQRFFPMNYFCKTGFCIEKTII